MKIGMFDLDSLKMTPYWGDEFYPSATDEQIAELEQLCGHPLLPLHKEILKKYNGGGPEANCFNMISSENGISLQWPFAYFYPLCEDRNKTTNLLNLVRQYRRFIGPDTLPFAESDYQEFYFFKWVDGEAQIWLFQFQEQDPESRFVTNSFEKLLGNLYFDEDLD
jgi:hypothetical protein